jgi:hypothetical protein
MESSDFDQWKKMSTKDQVAKIMGLFSLINIKSLDNFFTLIEDLNYQIKYSVNEKDILEDFFHHTWSKLKYESSLKHLFSSFKQLMKNKIYKSLENKLKDEFKGFTEKVKNGILKTIEEIEDSFHKFLKRILKSILNDYGSYKVSKEIPCLLYYYVSRKKLVKKHLNTLKILKQFLFFFEVKDKILFDCDDVKIEFYLSFQELFIMSNKEMIRSKTGIKDHLMEKVEIWKENMFINGFKEYLEKYLKKESKEEEKQKEKFSYLSNLLLDDKKLIVLSHILYSFSMLFFTKLDSVNNLKYNFSSTSREMLLNFLFTYQLHIKQNLKTEIDLINCYYVIEKHLYDHFILEEICISEDNEKDLELIHSTLNFKKLGSLISDQNKSLLKSDLRSSKKEYLENILNLNKILPEVNINLDYFKIIPGSKYMGYPNAVIFISGFLSRNQNEEINWKDIEKYEPFKYYDKFYLKWDSKDIQDLFKGPNFIELLASLFFKRLPSIFRDAQNSAKIHGMILAHLISSKKYFFQKTITLVGYSLGCHVIKHCLKELHSIERKKIAKTEGILQRIIFIAGATNFKNREKWKKIFQTIPGNIINLTSQNDFPLKKLFPIFCKLENSKVSNNNHKFPIGVKDFSIIVDKFNDSYDLITNHDLSGENIGHFNYMNLLSGILSLAHLN